MSDDPIIGSAERLIRVGGFAGIGIGLAYLVITGLYIAAGIAPDGGGGAYLDYLDGTTSAWWGIIGLSVLTDLLFLLFAPGLYRALEGDDRLAALVGTGLLATFAILDLAITWPTYAALVTLSGDRATADATQRAADEAAATWGSAILGSELFAAYAILVPAVGILVLGLAMRDGPFRRSVASLGVVTGIAGMVSVIGGFVSDIIGVGAILTSILTTVWVAFVGYRMVRLTTRGRSSSPGA